MAEQQLDGADIGAGFQQMDREGVPHGMRRDRLADAGELAGLLAGKFDGLLLIGCPDISPANSQPFGRTARQ